MPSSNRVIGENKENQIIKKEIKGNRSTVNRNRFTEFKYLSLENESLNDINKDDKSLDLIKASTIEIDSFL